MQRKGRLKKQSAAEEALEAIKAARGGERDALDRLEPDADLEDDVDLEDAPAGAQDAEYDDEDMVPAKRKATGACCARCWWVHNVAL